MPGVAGGWQSRLFRSLPRGGPPHRASAAVVQTPDWSASPRGPRAVSHGLLGRCGKEESCQSRSPDQPVPVVGPPPARGDPAAGRGSTPISPAGAVVVPVTRRQRDHRRPHPPHAGHGRGLGMTKQPRHGTAARPPCRAAGNSTACGRTRCCKQVAGRRRRRGNLQAYTNHPATRRRRHGRRDTGAPVVGPLEEGRGSPAPPYRNRPDAGVSASCGAAGLETVPGGTCRG